MMSPFVARGLPRCDAPAQDEELLRYARLEHGAVSTSWMEPGVLRAPSAGLGLRAWFGSIVRPLRRRSPDLPTVHAHANVAGVHFAESASLPRITNPGHELMASPVLMIAADSCSAQPCSHPIEH